MAYIVSSSVDEDPETRQKNILDEAHARFEQAKEAESEIRKLALEDLEFRAGEQWPDNIRQDRERDGRPCLVINRLPQFVQQVTNDQRQNRPAIKVHPVGDGADEETAKVIQGLIRHIEYNSNAEVAYDTAFESAVTGSLGYFRIVPDFISHDSFDQEIYIKRIKDPFSVFYDPFAQEADGSDASWAFIIDELSLDDYRSKYPESKLSGSSDDWVSVGNTPPEWVRKDGIRVSEYFCKEMKEAVIHLLKTGETVFDEALISRQMEAQEHGLDASVVKSRVTRIPIVKWYKINAIEILEETEFPVPYIPIIPVYGNELYYNGKRILESLIRHSKDPQRMLNYWKSAETEAIALAPRAPFIAAEGQLEGYEEDWKTANRRNHAYLYYKPTTIAGQPAPPPQRQAFEPAVQAITQASMGAAEDLKATTGVFDAGVGADGNEQSGVAIQRRANQIQTSTFHFTDNLTRSMRYAGRILIEMIPKIYDTQRATRIIKEDGEQKVVQLNQKYVDKDLNKEVLYDLSVGRYDVTVDTGPSFASKRQEAAAAMMDFSRAVPQVAQMCADLIVKNMDWPGAQDISDRLKKLLPPALQSDGKNQQIPPQVQAQMAQMAQMIQDLTKNLNECTKVIETKKLDLEHKERVEVMKTNAEVEMKLAELGAKGDIELLKQEVLALNHLVSQNQKRLQLLDVNTPIDAPDNFDPQQADGGNYAGIGHIGGTENLTGGGSPGENLGENP